MKRTALASALLVAALLAAACSDGRTPTDGSDRTADVDVSSDGTAALGAPGEKEDEKRKAGRKSRRPRRQVGKGEATSERTVRVKDGKASRSGDGPQRPPSGTFSLAQEGWEEFCQGGVCDREPLPRSVRLEIDHGANGAFTSRSESGSTDQTISYRRSGDRLLIERIVTASSYRGFSYRTTVEPQPPITSLVLPLATGGSWSGRWTNRADGPDGSYGGKVLKAVNAPQRGGEKAFLVELKLFFTGEVEGFTTLKATVADSDLMVLRVEAKTEARTRFGTYRSEYESEHRG